VPGTSSPAAPPRPAATPSLRPAPDPISLDRAAPPEAAPASGELPHDDPKPLVAGLTADGLTPDEAVNVAVYDKCNRGVVNITSKGLPGERFLFMEVPEEGSGSGSIIDRQGHVLTNYHVVENAQQIEVALYDGSTFPGKPVGADPVNDLAVLKIDAPPEKLFPIEIGDSGRLKVGMRIFAIGNPFGLERTMTHGVVSSLNRSLQIRGNRSIKAIIQVDAAVNPGNSGGPLLDARGQLVGVTTAIATRVGQSAGVGLAIPATLVSRVVPQLIRHGRVIRPEIGIQQVLETEDGLRIASLTPGGPAERAGLRGPQIARTRRGPFVWEQIDRSTADMIVAVDGETVETADDFLNLVERKRPGDTVTVRVQRGNQTADVPVVLAGPPLNEQAAPPAQLEPLR
jgi:S1-C subfamily serine protease